MNAPETQIELPNGRNDRPWELRLQRLGWLLFGVMVLAGLAGLLGRGPLSATSARSASGAVTVEYHRFERYHGPTEFLIELERPAATNGEARLWISQSLLGRIEIESIQPEPNATVLGPDRQVFVFDAAGLTGSGQVILRYLPDAHFGWMKGQIGVEGADRAEVAFLVYP